MSNQQFQFMDINSESYQNVMKSNFNSIEQNKNPNGYPFGNIIINNAVINNFNNNNHFNNNFANNKNKDNSIQNQQQFNSKVSLNSKGVYNKKNIIKPNNLNALSHNKNDVPNNPKKTEIESNKIFIKKVLDSPNIINKGGKTVITSKRNIKPKNLLKSMQDNYNKSHFDQINNEQSKNKLNQMNNQNNIINNINFNNKQMNIVINENNNYNKNINQQNFISNSLKNQNNQNNNLQINDSLSKANTSETNNKYNQINSIQNNNEQINFNQNSNQNNINMPFNNQNKIYQMPNPLTNIENSNYNKYNNFNPFQSPYNLQPKTNQILNQKTNQIIQNDNQLNNMNKIRGLNENFKSEVNKMNIRTNNNYSFSNYKIAAKTGLRNLLQTSYLNSVLQLLGSIRSFSSSFLNPGNGNLFRNNLEKYSLCFVIHRLCYHLYPYPEKRGREIYRPDSLMSILGKFNLVYRDLLEKDPKMLLVFILGKLHAELNGEKINDLSNNNINLKIACDRNATINIGLLNLRKTNKSVIFNYFNWFEIKETKCLKCSGELYDFLNFSTFELNIFDCARYRRLKSIRLEDCLDFYIIPKIKKKFCYFCQSYNEMTTTTQIYSSPNIFIFLLNLENNTDDSDFDNVNFILEKKINLGNFIENKHGPLNYEITGIVFLDKYRNKYFTLCCSPVDLNWYLYEDEKVTLENYDSFMLQTYNKDFKYKPCILLYKNINVKN
mgnify:CR=1 FL=1